MEFIISWLYNDKYVKTNNFEFYFFCFFDTNLCKSWNNNNNNHKIKRKKAYCRVIDSRWDVYPWANKIARVLV